MKWLVNLTDITLINELNANETDFYIEVKNFSRFGKIDRESSIKLAEAARQKGFQCALQLDLLLTESEFLYIVDSLNRDYLNLFDSVRLQDPGLVQWFKDNNTEILIDLILETGHHNLISIQTWEKYLGAQLHKIVLSNEIPKTTLSEYRKHLKAPIEIQGAGRLLLFYTPRNLLSAQFVDHDDSETKRVFENDFIEVLGASEESPHKGFPIIENSHGTFMFLPKDYYILDSFKDILEIEVDYVRVDFSHLKNTNELYSYLNSFNIEKLKELKNIYPNKTIKGYFNINKSDVLFDKLKNKKVLRKDENYCGEVLEVCKDTYMAVKIDSERGIKLQDVITYYSPDSKIKTHNIFKLMNSNKEEVNSIAKGKIAFLPHVGGISVKTQVYFGLDPFSLKP